MFQHVVHTLTSEELIRMCGLAETVKEEREVVMVVKLLDLNLEEEEEEKEERKKEKD